jgi:hypothetical protein
MGRRIAYASVALTEDRDRDRLVAHATAGYVLPERDAGHPAGLREGVA